MVFVSVREHLVLVPSEKNRIVKSHDQQHQMLSEAESHLIRERNSKEEATFSRQEESFFARRSFDDTHLCLCSSGRWQQLMTWRGWSGRARVGEG